MKRIALFAFLTFALVFGGVTQAFAGDAEFTLNLGTLAPKGTPWGKQLKQYKKKVEADSGGRIKVRLHFSGRKGDEKSMVRQLNKGALQGFGGSTGAVASIIPEMALFELPYLFKSQGLKLYIMAENGYRNFATKGKVIHGPADMKGLPMRSQELWVHSETYSALSANPIKKPVSEVTSALTSGNIAGFDNTPLFASAYGWVELIDTWNVSDHIYQPALIAFNKEWFDGLPADLQTIVLADQKLQTKLGRKLVRKMNKKLMKQLETNEKVTVYTLTDAEKAAMAKATKSVHAEFKKRVGAEGARLLDLVYGAK